MAGIFGQIPMPMNAMDAFMQGMQSSQSMFDSFMKNKLTPYQIELLKAQSEEAKGKGAEANMFSQLLNKYGNLGGSIPAQSQESPMTGSAPAGTFPQTGGITAQGNAAPNPITQKGNEDLPPSNPFIATRGAGSGDDTHAPTTMPPAAMAQANEDSGERFGHAVIGAKLGVPAQTFNTEGKVGSVDPITGKVTSTQIGENPEEKGNREIKQKLTEEEKIADIKDSKSIKESANAIADSAETLRKINEIINNPKNKNLTGWGYKIPGAASQSSNKDIGSLIALTSKLQAQFAKAENSKAGIGLVNFFKTTKPDVTNSSSVNKGMAQALIEETESKFNKLKEDWERMNPGKEFPVKQPNFRGTGGNKHWVVDPQTGEVRESS